MHDYWKTIALTRQTFVGQVMSLLFNMLFRLVITFLPRSKHLLISWLQSPSAVILEPPKIKSATISTVSPSICHEVMGPDATILVFWMLSFKPTFWLSSLREDSTHGHHQMVNTEIRLIIFFAAKDELGLYSQQKQDRELTVAWIMNSLLQNSDLNWRK